MVWTSEELYSLEDAPFPCNKEELIEYANDRGLSKSVIENLVDLEEEEEGFEITYESLKDICPDLFYYGMDLDDNEEDY